MQKSCLKIPAVITFPCSPVHYTTSRTVLIQNTADHFVSYELITEPPFSVSPSTGELDIKQSQQLTVYFTPTV